MFSRAKMSCHRGRHVFVLAADESRAFLDHRDFGSEPPVHLGELEPHIAAAHDDEVTRQLFQGQHRSVGEVVDGLDPPEGRNVRTRTGVDEDALGS